MPLGVVGGLGNAGDDVARVAANASDDVAKAARPTLTACKEALAKVHDKVGKLMQRGKAKFGSPMRGTPQKGYRLDPPHPKAAPGSPEAGWHMNWWDWTMGKRGAGGRHGAIPIPPPRK